MQDKRSEEMNANYATDGRSGSAAVSREYCPDYDTAYDYSPFRENVAVWSDLSGTILEIGGERGAVTGALLKKGGVVSVEPDPEKAAALRERYPEAKVVASLGEAGSGFDCAVMIGSLEEYSDGDEVGFLKRVTSLLKPDGRLLIAVDNSLAAGRLSGRAAETYKRSGYSLSEFRAILDGAGLNYSSVLYPAPDYRFTNVIFSDRQLPDGESIKRRLVYFPSYPTATFNENAYLRRFIETEKESFPLVSDAFLAEASLSEAPKEPKLVCFSLYRKPEYRVFTVVDDEYAHKYPTNDKARAHIEAFGKNIAELKENGLTTPDSYSEGVITSRICRGKTLDMLLLDAYQSGGVSAFKTMADEFFAAVSEACGEGSDTDTIFERFSVELTDGQRAGLRFLKRGYMDMIFQNCFVEDGRYVFYDQEWRFENTPLEYIIFRALTNSEVISETVGENLFELFGIAEYLPLFEKLNGAFADEVYSDFYKKWYAVRGVTPRERTSALRAELAAAESDIKTLRKNNASLRGDINAAKETITGLRDRLDAIENRKLRRRCVNYMHAHPALHRFVKAVFAPCNYVRCRIRQRRENASPANRAETAYSLWLKHNTPDKNALEKQRNRVFPSAPVFSILTPLYNTDKKMLEEMIASVTAQTYPHWELCLADASDAKHDYVGRTALAFAESDPRIKYTRLKENRGIAGNTNAAAKLAGGDYIALLDHDDALAPDALYEMAAAVNDEPDADFIYTDEDKFTDIGGERFDPHFKPDFSIFTLRSFNYICHFTALKKTLFDGVGGFASGYDGAQDYDLFLRASEKAALIKHIPKPLYHWRVHPASTASAAGSKSYAEEAGRKAVEAHLKRVGIDGEALTTDMPFRYRVKYPLTRKPLVSVLIPNKDSADELKKCVDSVLFADYGNTEIIIIENNSVTPEIGQLYETLSADPRIRIVRYENRGFNYSAINNYGASFANGELLLLMNNDIEAIGKGWLSEMVSVTLQDGVVAAGARLLYPDDTVQHSGVIIGLGGVAGHIEKMLDDGDCGYFGYGKSTHEVGAVTAACMLVRRDAFDAAGGLDEKFAVAFNDIDLCMKLRANGGKIIYTPHARLYHYESKSRGRDDDTPEKIRRFKSEIDRFQSKWAAELSAGDPFFNKNLRLDSNEYLPRTEKVV